jgi:hypothetical protein
LVLLLVVLGSGCCCVEVPVGLLSVLFSAAVVVVGALGVVLLALMDGVWCWWDLARGVHGLTQSVTDFD